eukprot:ctg_2000.g581
MERVAGESAAGGCGAVVGENVGNGSGAGGGVGYAVWGAGIRAGAVPRALCGTGRFGVRTARRWHCSQCDPLGRGPRSAADDADAETIAAVSMELSVCFGGCGRLSMSRDRPAADGAGVGIARVARQRRGWYGDAGDGVVASVWDGWSGIECGR